MAYDRNYHLQWERFSVIFFRPLCVLNVILVPSISIKKDVPKQPRVLAKHKLRRMIKARGREQERKRIQEARVTNNISRLSRRINDPNRSRLEPQENPKRHDKTAHGYPFH